MVGMCGLLIVNSLSSADHKGIEGRSVDICVRVDKRSGLVGISIKRI